MAQQSSRGQLWLFHRTLLQLTLLPLVNIASHVRLKMGVMRICLMVCVMMVVLLSLLKCKNVFLIVLHAHNGPATDQGFLEIRL
jgi:hypothetical protein